MRILEVKNWKVTLDRDERAKLLKKARAHQGLSSQFIIIICCCYYYYYYDDNNDNGCHGYTTLHHECYTNLAPTSIMRFPEIYKQLMYLKCLSEGFQ